MANALEWMFKMQDLVSGPSARMERQLKSLTLAMKALSMQSRATQVGPLANGVKYQTSLLRSQRDQLLLNKMAMGQHSSVLSTLAEKFKGGRQAMRDWLLILDPLARGLRWVAHEAVSLGHSIAKAITTREEAMIGLKSAFGQQGGRAVLDQMQGIATRTGRPVGELLDRATHFGNLGAPKDLLAPMVMAISDAQARKLDAGRLEQTLTSMLSRPVLDMREIKGGLTGVMDEKLFWNQLAKNLHVSPGDANQMVERNMVPRRVGLDSALQAFAGTQGGRLGVPTMDRANNTLQGMLDRFEERTTKLLAGIADTPGFKTFKQALNNLLSVLSQSKMQKLVNDLANTLGDALKPLTGPDGKKRMEAFFAGMQAGIKSVLPGLKEMVDGFGYVGKFILGTAKLFGYLGKNAGENLGAIDTLLGGDNRFAKTEALKQLLGLNGDGSPSPTPNGGDAPRARMTVPPIILNAAPRPRMTVPPIILHIRVDARGATKEAAHDIAKEVSDQVPTHIADAIEQMANEQGAY